MRTDVFKARIKSENTYLHLLAAVVLSSWRRLGILPYFALKSPLQRVINSNYLHFSIILVFPAGRWHSLEDWPKKPGL